MEDINLHFTGDFHAIGAANNLLAAMLDNHIQQGNALGIDVRKITWKRVRGHERPPAAQHRATAWAAKPTACPARTASTSPWPSEIMAIFCLATIHHRPEGAPGPHRGGLHLRRRARHRRTICKPQGAMAALLQGRAQAQSGADARGHARVRARRPLRQHRARLQLHHGHAHGPGAGRLRRHRGGLRRRSGRGEVPRHQVPPERASSPTRWSWWPRCGRSRTTAAWPKAELQRREPARRSRRACPTCCSMWRTSRRCISLPCVVAINRFPTDTEAELKLVEDKCRELGVNVALSEVWAQGRRGRPGAGRRGRAPVRRGRRGRPQRRHVPVRL